MSLKYGFYNSVNGDRVYDARDFSRIFDGVIKDGIYRGVGEAFSVAPSTGLSVTLGRGKAWFNGTWTYSDSIMTLNLPTASSSGDRIDAIVLKVDTSDEVRANSIEVISGTASANPTPPDMTDTSTVFYHPIAFVTVSQGATSLSDSDIDYVVGKDDRTQWADIAYYTGEYDYSWADIPDDLLPELMRKVDAGQISLTTDLCWASGDERRVELSNGETITLVLSDPGHYELATPTASGRTTCHFTLIMKETTGDLYQIAEGGTYPADVSWDGCVLRNTLNTVFINYFPTGLKNALKRFVVKTITKPLVNTITESIDILSIPSVREYDDNTTLINTAEMDATSGLDYYKIAANRSKQPAKPLPSDYTYKTGQAWLRSTVSNPRQPETANRENYTLMTSSGGVTENGVLTNNPISIIACI